MRIMNNKPGHLRGLCFLFYLFILFSPVVLADTTIKSVRAHGYHKVENNINGFGDIIRWSRDYDAEDIQQLLQAVPEIRHSNPGNQLLLQVAADKVLFAPTELNLAIERSDSLIQSLLFWLPLLNRLSGSGEEQRLSITLDNALEEPGLYLKKLPGAIDLQHSFMVNAAGNRVSLSVGNPVEARANGEALTALTFLEIRSEPCSGESSEDSQNALPLSGDELKKSLGQGDLLLTGGGGGGFGGDFKPDHRPGGGGGQGGPTENMLMISMALSLTGQTRKEDNLKIQFSPRRQQHSVLVQTVSPDGLVIREQFFSLEQIMESVAASQSLTEESEELARQLVRNAMRIQTHGDPVQALKNLFLTSGCLPDEIPDMISCAGGRGGKKGQSQSRSSGSGRQSDARGTGGTSQWFSSSGGGSAFGLGSGGGDDRDPRKNGGRKPLRKFQDSDSEEEEEQSAVAIDKQAAEDDIEIGGQEAHIRREVSRWNSGMFSQRINWPLIYPYLPQEGLDIERFLELTRSPDNHTYDALAALIEQTDMVTRHTQWRNLIAYKYLRAGLRNYLKKTGEKAAREGLTESEQSNLVLLDNYFKVTPADLDPGIEKIAYPAPVGISWDKMVELAGIVFKKVRTAYDLLGQRTENQERLIQYYIYEFLSTKSDDPDDDFEAMSDTSQAGRESTQVGTLATALKYKFGVAMELVYLALAARDNFVSTERKIRPEPKVTEAIKKYMLQQWGTMDEGSPGRQALAQFSIMVMGDNFLPPQAQPVFAAPRVKKQMVAPLPPVKPGLDTKPTMSQLIALPHMREGKINVIEHIATKYFGIGIFLLNDDSGSKVTGFEMANHYQPIPTMTAIIQKWLDDDKNPTWRGLVDALRTINLNSMARKIEEALRQ